MGMISKIQNDTCSYSSIIITRTHPASHDDRIMLHTKVTAVTIPVVINTPAHEWKLSQQHMYYMDTSGMHQGIRIVYSNKKKLQSEIRAIWYT